MLVSFNLSLEMQVVEVTGFTKTIRCVSRSQGYCSCGNAVERSKLKQFPAQVRFCIDAFESPELELREKT